MPNQTAEIFEATNAEYHARADEVGHSELDEFIEDPATYHMVRVTHELPRKEATPEMEFGSLFHAYMLEPHTVVEIPADVLGKGGIKAGGEYKAFAAEHAGKFLVTRDAMIVLRQMEAAIERHDKARWIVRECRKPELNIRWQDEETGIWCRCRIDAPHDGVLLADLKSAAALAPKRFVDAILRYGYQRQAAHYADGWEALTGERLSFVFVAVTKQQPFQAETYEISERFVGIGRRQNRRWMRHLKHCLETDTWTYPGHGKIKTLDAPAYAESNLQWE